MIDATREKFLQDAERHLLTIVEQKSNFGVWRQPLKAGHLKVGQPKTSRDEIDTVIVGLRDQATPNQPGQIVLTVTAEDDMFEIVFKEPTKPSWSHETNGLIGNGMKELHRVGADLLKI